MIQGIKAYFGTFELISKLKLWKYFAVPMIISFVVAIVIGGLSYVFSDNIGNYIASFWQWGFGKSTFETISNVFGGLIIIALGFILFKHIVMALSAPFMGPISKKIEDHLTGGALKTKESSSIALLTRGVRISLRNLLRELILTLPILLLGLIPVIGFFSAALLFLMQAYFAGFGNMDYTLERHFDYKNSVKFVKRNRGIATGNGIVFMLFLLIPVVGVILVLPFSVTAATVETVKLIQQEK
ncbi:MAG: EI24 domain-containing protein [Flavobacteriaceae bacterium]|nr:EI24 domain-containing protein [Flavobacteriaceae bacterium]